MKTYECDSLSDLVVTNPALDDQDPPVKHGDKEDEDENTARGNWTNKKEYLLSMIGFAVGIGNIWRFPYLTYKNGGGAFLIPYFIMLMVAGIPLYFLESAMGQFCSQGPINVWRAVPALQGVGVATVAVNGIVSIYYNVIMSYSLHYFFASFQSPLPWSSYTSWAGANCSLTPLERHNATALPAFNRTTGNGSCLPSGLEDSPSEQYWDRAVLHRSSGLHETGPIVWQLALCLLLSSVLIAAMLFRGIKSSGKVVYFTATFPYVVLAILLIRGVTLEGAGIGLQFYIGSQSNLTKLVEAEVWRDAATQTFYSLSIAFGGVTALSSYSRFHNNLLLDTMVVTFTNCATSVFAGFTIFSILGHMAHVYGKPVHEVAQGGFGLAFIVYPDALAKLPFAPLWSILFFLMLFTLGLDTQFAGIEVVSTCLQDAFPKYFKSRRTLSSVVICALMFFLGLPCVTRAGIYWVTLMDQFVSSWVLLILAVLEIIGFIYIYGGNRFIEDIEMMIGTKSVWFWLWWRACWYFITPAIIVIILIWSLLTFTPPTYGTVQYPPWGLALGWCMAIFCLLWIPFLAVHKLMQAQGDLSKRVRSVFSPSVDWHPYLDVHRGERYSEGCSGNWNIPVINVTECHVNVIAVSRL